jgi:hypothetical protein
MSDIREALNIYAQQVKKMRAAQANYFRYRTAEWLEDSKTLEKLVDQLTLEILQPDKQLSLFDNPQNKPS